MSDESCIISNKTLEKPKVQSRIIESNTDDRSRSRNLRHLRVRFQSFSDEAYHPTVRFQLKSYPRGSEISRSWPVICVWLFFLHRHPPKFFFLCGEILLGCVLFGHISWNEYIWQWISTSPFYRTIWLGRSI